ncbi:MAG: SdrD B-like domain-containing protein [Prosthecobacter sp.]
MNLDNGVDNDSNGIQSGGMGGPVRSPVITLTLNAEPGNLATGGTNQEMSIDFGFCASLVLGNFVFSDVNNNGVVNAGEGGVEGAQVELYSSTDNTVNNGNDVKVGTTFITGADGLYSFAGLSAGKYYIKLTPPITHPRRSSTSSNADNGIDNDNNGVSQSTTFQPIYSPVITLSALTEPGNLVAPFGGNTDNTLDFGLRPTFNSIGNLVYKDANGNGRFDSGEGMGGVRVELYNSSGVFVTSTTTSTGSSTRGRYIFSNVLPGGYFVRIPASEFGVGKALVNTVSISPALPTDDGLDDNLANNDNGIDNAQPSLNGISSALITVSDSAEPVNGGTETGAFNTLDDADDNNGDMTVDFGFKASGPSATGCYNFILADTDLDGALLPAVADWTPDQPYDFTYAANIAHVSNFDLTYDAALSRLKLDATFQQMSGMKVDSFCLLVSTGPNPRDGNHAILYFDGFNRAAPQITLYRFDTTLGGGSWQTASNILLSTAPGSTTAADVLQMSVSESGVPVRFQFTIDMSRVNNGANWTGIGVDQLLWEGMLFGDNAGISLRTVDLSTAPTYNASGALTAYSYTPSSTTEGSFDTDPSGVFVIVTQSCPISPWVSIGNLVWADTDLDGIKDASEAGIPNMTVQLFNPGTDNAIGGTGSAADTQVGAAALTTSTGAYQFPNLVPGKYFVRVTPNATYPATGGNVITSDNGIDNDNNGSQPSGPGTNINSPIIDLAVNAEPEALVDGDGRSSDATIDFGLFTGFTVGDVVWNDANNNGLRDSGTEQTSGGITGVQVELMNPGADNAVGGSAANADSILQTTSTASGGAYSFRVYTPGNYYVRITPTTSFPLVSGTVVTTDNGVNNDNNGSQPNGAGTDVHSMVFTLTPGVEPGSTGTSNSETTIDFGLRACPVITISPTTLADGMRGTSYSATFTALGGNSPYTWSIASGTLPTGMSLSSAGVLSGTLNATPAVYSFTVRATDSSNCSVTQAMTLRVTCPVLSLSPTTLTATQQGSVFSQTFTTSGGTAPYTYSRPVGAFPAGLTLSTGGVLSGTITGAPATYVFTIRSTDVNGCFIDQSFNWVITCPTVTIGPASIPAATQYSAYAAQTFTASGANVPVTWSYTGTLPAGMTFSAGGILSGTPTSTPGTYNITVTATDNAGCVNTRVVPIVVNCPTINISAPAFPSGTKNVLYPDQQLSASGGTAPYQWTIASGSLPPGLSLSTSGLISGTITAAPATYSFTVRATDAVNCSSTSALSIVVACSAMTIGPVALPNATQYAAYSQNLSVSGGTAPYTWTLASGLLPGGLTLSSGGVISGTPLGLGSATVDIRVTDADGCSVIRRYTLPVDCPPITITPSTLTNAARNTPYTTQLIAGGGTPGYRFNVQSGSLPTGLTLTTGGLLSGTITAAPGSYSFTIRALDLNDCPGTQPFTLQVICPGMSITPPSLTNATVGTAYSQALSASGGTAPYVWSVISGTLPNGVSLSTNGILSGTPTQATTATFTIEARDAFNCTVTQLYSLVVNCPAITVTPATLPNGYLSAPYSQQLTAAGGTGPYTWQIIAGSPPAGLSMDSSGLISGTPAAYGAGNFTVRVTDAYNCTANQSYSILIKGLSLGDMVFDDANYNGYHDNDEPGVKDVTVELWDPGADNAVGGSGPNSDLLITSMTTGALGQYHFNNLQPGYYYVRVLPPTNLRIQGANPVDADNSTDRDNNGVSQPGGPGTVIFTPVVQLTTSGETTSEDSDPDTDFTLDVGLFRGMSLGNLVWQDTDDDGIKDAGETGINGVSVEVWNAGADGKVGGTDDVLLQSTTTASGGLYTFNDLPPVTVYVRLPAPPAAQPLSSSVTSLRDNGIDNDDNGIQIGGGAIYSPIVTLSPANEPGTGGGTYVENTIDFGLQPVTPTIYVSATQDDSIQVFNASTGLYNGNLVNTFGASHSQGNGDWGDVPYSIELGPDGNWYAAHYGASNLRKISPSGTDLGTVLNNSTASVSWIACFAIGPDGNFYVVDVNGNRVVRFQGPGGTTPGAPMGVAPFSFISQAGILDINFGPDGNLYLVVQNGSLREIRRYSTTTGTLLNTIVTDSQIVTMVPGGQAIALVSGIDIHGSTLYGVNRSDGEIFRIDLSDPSAPGLPELVATISSAGKGFVETADLEYNPANNRIYISGFNWSKPVVGGGSFISGSLVRVDPTAAPNGTVEIFEVPIPTPPGPNNEIWPGPRDLAIGKPLAPLANAVAIGSLVWNDLDADGIQDADENGIPGVKVELWRDVNGNSADGAEVLIGWTFTASNGFYYFSGQAPGVYQVRVPATNFSSGQPLAGSGNSSPVTVNADNQTDGDDNGNQPGGTKTEVSSPLITLSPGTEPTGNGISGTELRLGGELDDHTVDANGDMTVDFGFVEPGNMGIANHVFNDANGNGRFDNGEGVNDAVVELYQWGNVPGSDLPFATTTSANGGKYLFPNLFQGQYFVHLPAAQFTNSGDLRGLYSLPGTSAGDDNIGEDGVDAASPFVTGISSGRVTLTRDSAPLNSNTETGFDSTTDDADDKNVDLTVDFGLFRPVAVGNLVFGDSNSNGRFDAGEGLSGVRVEVYKDTQAPGVDSPLAFANTDTNGRYLFDYLLAGNYIVHIPKSQFLTNKPLFQRISINEGLSGDDDVGEDGINVADPSVTGISSLPVSIYPGSAPTGDTGESGNDSASDDQNDAAVDLTIDFGFQTPVGIGNLVFSDLNGNGVMDSNEGVDGVTVELYRSTQTPGQAVPLFSDITSGGGRYFFGNLSAGDYIVHISSANFAPGGPLAGLQSVSGVSATSNGIDDNTASNDNGIDEAAPHLNGVSSAVVALTVDGEPKENGGETGTDKDMDSFDDDNYDLTIDFGFSPANPNGVGIGNLVWRDLDGDEVYDSGEGVDGVKVRLFLSTADPRTGAPLAEATTANGGVYYFSNLVAGEYIVFIPASEFQAGKPLAGWTSLAGGGADDGVDDNVYGSDNGIDDLNPDVNGIMTQVITLDPDSEPVNSFSETGAFAYYDDFNDNNADLTIDFGFYRSVSVGNVIFKDANYNGIFDAGEGVNEPVTLELYRAQDVIPFDPPWRTTTTSEGGSYLFTGLTPGSYYIRVAPENFLFGMPLHNHASVRGMQTGDDNLGEDGIDHGNPASDGIRSDVFTLSAITAPSGTLEPGFQGTSDDLNDNAVDLTRDFGFVPQVTIGNLVFNDSNNDGIFDPNTESGVGGVTVELWTNAANATSPAATTMTLFNGSYSFSVAPGGYYIRIPASEFASGMPLADTVPSQPENSTLPENTNGDDHTGQDGYTTGSVLTDGARTPLFTVLKDSAPLESGGELGYLSESDDFDDANGDLTVDLGFSPKPLAVGNLVFRDLDGDGKYSSTDFGVPGVIVKMYEFGDDPNNASTLPVAQAVTGVDGSYLIRVYQAGNYFLHIPKSEFASGKLLAGTTPLTSPGSDDGVDDSFGQNALATASPATTGVSTTTFLLDYGTEPTTTESGFLGTSDDSVDADTDLTIDFGFSGGGTLQLMTIGNLVFNDANHNLVADAGEGVPNVWMLLHLNQEFPNGNVTYIRSTYTDANGRYIFNNLNPGEYVVHVAADNFKASAPHMSGAPGPLYRKLSLRSAKPGDDNVGEDGMDDEQPELRGISSGIVTLATGSAPVGAAESGFQGSSDNASGDNMTDLTIDFGFDTRIGGGNLVFRDNNADGKFAAGTDTPLSGVLVQLRHVDTTTGIETVISKSWSGTDGSYLVVGPPAVGTQKYYIHIPASQFAAGGPLEFLVPTSLTTFGDDDNQNQNLLPSANPEVAGASTEISNGDILPGEMPTDANNEETGFNKTSDNDDDANIDLTIDLGLKPKAMMVGNLVFRDVNGNNIFDPGIDMPMSGVAVRLFQASQPITAQPVSETITGPNGTYTLYATAAAAYYVHIPGAMFQPGAPLAGLTSITGNGGPVSNANTLLDDLYDENGIDNSNLAQDGIRTGNFNLAYGTMPLNTTSTQTFGENGYESQMDDLADASGLMTIDFGFKLLNAPPLSNAVSNDLSAAGAAASASPANTFAAWNTQNLDPLADADSDGLSNLLEYALGTPAAHGHHASRFQLVQNSTTGLIDAVFSRATSTLADVRYSLETSSDLQTWKTLSTTPRLTQVNGLTQSTTPAIDQKDAAGFIRLKVVLDADLNGTPEAITTSAIHAWSRLQALPGRQTLSMPLMRPAIFRGAVQTVNDRTLVILNGTTSIHNSFTAGEKYFVEVLSGPLAGRVLDVETSESTGNTLTLASTADARLAGARVAIRPHHTLATLIPADSLCGAAESGSADRVMFFDNTVNAFRVFWIKSDGTSLQWVREGDATLSDASRRVVRPQEGMLLQIRNQASTITLFGELRLTPETPGSSTQFRDTGSALPQAPSTLEARPGSKLRLWSGDADPATGTYFNYQLDPAAHWIDARTNLDVSAQKLLQPFRAHFFTPAN